MKKILVTALTFFAICCLQFAYAAQPNTSPVGYWKTIDDITGQAKSVLQINQSSDGTLSGRVVKLFKDAQKVCTACEGSLKNQPILGMVVMHGLKQNHDKPEMWEDGKILDPKSGKTYHCYLQVIDNGQKLNVRGYIGIAMFGRTQTWLRVANSSSN